ncbi:hypothetical protein niasHT_003905 [Heterodera trifolii]|uniref:Protein quiver n=1 Tax=Heterodera trifolii TaxID=157864 RepID=A0ABD2LV45_9BILA
MPWGDWATTFPRKIFASITLVHLFSICMVNSEPISSSRGNGPMGRRLNCLSCVRVDGDTTTLDQFRVRHGLLQPNCDMETVQCDVHQDTCVTITMQVSQRQFWIGSGCDQRVNYDFPSGGREGCVEMPSVYRNFFPGFMEERRTLQRVCLCSANLCNSARPTAAFLRFLPVLLLATLSFLIPLLSFGTVEETIERHR